MSDEPEPDPRIPDVDVEKEIISKDDGDTVGLSTASADWEAEGFEQIFLSVEALGEFVEQCEQMGWDRIRIQVLKNYLVFGQEVVEGEDGDYVAPDHDIHAVIAPILPSRAEDDDD